MGGIKNFYGNGVKSDIEDRQWDIIERNAIEAFHECFPDASYYELTRDFDIREMYEDFYDGTGQNIDDFDKRMVIFRREITDYIDDYCEKYDVEEKYEEALYKYHHPGDIDLYFENDVLKVKFFGSDFNLCAEVENRTDEPYDLDDLTVRPHRREDIIINNDDQGLRYLEQLGNTLDIDLIEKMGYRREGQEQAIDVEELEELQESLDDIKQKIVEYKEAGYDKAATKLKRALINNEVHEHNGGYTVKDQNGKPVPLAEYKYKGNLLSELNTAIEEAEYITFVEKPVQKEQTKAPDKQQHRDLGTDR